MAIPTPSRRWLIGSALALAACDGKGQAQSAAIGPIPPLKEAAPFPVGAAVHRAQLADTAADRLISTQFDQITADWEMKMEVILREDGGFDFSIPDAIAAYARSRGLRLHGHTLIWYIYKPAAFERIAGDRPAFANAYRNYILAVAGRFRGLASGWDVVNEPVAEDGEGYRECLWRQVFGMDYVERAFREAREADPGSVLFLNDYNLELNPKKRVTFLRLAEDLLKRGAPLGGLGTQTHLSFDAAPGQIRAAVRDMASLGLPIHISEMDVSTRRRGLNFPDRKTRLDLQARLVGEAAEAFSALPAAQRYAFTVWGARDRDSWLRRDANDGGAEEMPLLFDDEGQAKPAALAFIQAAARAN